MAALLLLGAGSDARSQDEAGQGAGVIETVRVNLVEVDVVVTDAKGNPVTGLTAEDFRVTEDGRKVKLTHFRAGHGSQPAASLDPAEQAPRPAQPGNYMVLLVDNYAIHPADRRRVVAGLRDYLERGDFEDAWVAVASYEGYLRMRQTFTRDKTRLLTAINSLEEINSLGTALIADRTATFRHGLDTLRSIEDLAGSVDDDDLARRMSSFSRQIAAYAEDVRQQNRSAFHAIGHLVNALSPLPGRKAVIYVSEGLPMRPGDELQAATEEIGARLFEGRDMSSAAAREADIDRRSGALDVLSESAARTGRRDRRSTGTDRQRPDGLLELTAMANAYQVSFYTLKPLTEYGGLPAEIGGGTARIFTPRVQKAQVRNLAETLEVMAGDTGGLSYFGSGIEGLLDRAGSEITEHYSLAYAPDHAGDGRFHEIKVKVRGKKLRVRHRGGYVDKSIEAKIADHTTAALLMALDNNPHNVVLGTGNPQSGPKDSQWIVPIEVEIPLAGLVLADRGDSLVSEIRLFVAARGADGRSAPVQALEVRIEVPRTVHDPRSESYTARFNLLLRVGAQRIAVGLLDPAAETVSFVSRDIRVGVEG